MASRPKRAVGDRVSELLEGRQRRTREIVTPEGVPIHVDVADRGERLGAFLIDMVIWFGATIVIWITLISTVLRNGGGADIAVTAISFLSFLLRNLYFIHFELAWQGQTPGKRVTGLKVIDRKGGVLTPAAIVARNLTREIEFFLPLQLTFGLMAAEGDEAWQILSMLGWVILLTALPFFNRDHLRAGDLIGGTLVISLPKRSLALDLTQASARASQRYSFTTTQLQAYGAYELQVLEEILRRPDNVDTARIHREVAEKIIRRVGWQGSYEANAARDFLQAFYAAERAELERGQLFGRYRDDKNSGLRRAGEPAEP